MILPVILFLVVPTIYSINKKCSFIQTCPGNAECSPLTDYCVCQPGFIGNCNIEAGPLTQYPQVVELRKDNYKYFYMNPVEVSQFIQFTLSICREKEAENVPIVVSMWTEKGLNQQYLPNNTLNHPINLTFESACNNVTIKFAIFNMQINGQSEKLIIGIGENKNHTIITLSISQKIILGITYYYYIMGGILVFISILSITSAVVIMLRRRRLPWIFRSGGYFVDNGVNLQHFQIFMPSVPAGKDQNGHACPICLQNIQIKQDIRNTPCNHTFHTPCLDSWCSTNLNCPVCRSDFSVEKIGEIKKSVSAPQKCNKVELSQVQENMEREIQMEEVPGQQLRQPIV